MEKVSCVYCLSAIKVLNKKKCFLSCRSWDLNKICYKSGVPIIENVMIERVSSQQIDFFFLPYIYIFSPDL